MGDGKKKATNFVTPEQQVVSDNVEDSDSDVSSDGVPDYYQPISSYPADDDDNDDDNDDEDDNHPISNGHYHPAVDNGQSEEVVVDEEDEDEDEQELRRRAEEDSAIRRAFLQDDSRRNAPLPSHNAALVIQAMRSVSLSGFSPDWALRVPEDRWLHQLHHIRHPPTPSSSPP